MPRRSPPLIILVTGVLERDSGKTTFCSYLTRLLSYQNLRVIPFKPLSGHSFYFQFPNTKKNARLGTIASQDIQSLMDVISSKSLSEPNLLPIEILNPSHVLFTEKALIPYIEQDMVRSYFAMPSRTVPLMQRFTVLQNSEEESHQESMEHIYVVREDIEEISSRLVVDSRLFPQLYSNASKVLFVKESSAFIEFSKKYLDLAVTSCFKKLREENPEVILIEGFNNAALPCTSNDFIKHIRMIYSVGPGILLSFDRDKYLETAKILSSQTSFKVSTIVENILEFSKPKKVLEVPLGIDSNVEANCDAELTSFLLERIKGQL